MLIPGLNINIDNEAQNFLDTIDVTAPAAHLGNVKGMKA